jgi:branched-chain amino acid transport system permease protein
MSMAVTFQWGITRELNFAIGGLATLGAFITWGLLNNLTVTIGYFESFSVMVIALFLIGIVFNRLILEPFRNRANAQINIFVGSLGASALIENIILLIFGGRLKQLPPVIEGLVQIGPMFLDWHRIIITLIALSTLIVLALVLKKMRVGLAIRAVAQDQEAAYLMGINVKSSFAIAVALATVFAGIAGTLLGSILFITPTMGTTPLLKAFFVVVLGGLGSIKGTILASLIIGEIEAVAMYFLGIFWSSPVLFSIMILILLLRPHGLYGEKEVS